MKYRNRADVLRSPEFLKNVERAFQAELDNIKKGIEVKAAADQGRL